VDCFINLAPGEYTLHKRLLLSLSFLVVLFAQHEIAVAQVCTPPAVVANARSYNIFSAEQEMMLGDLTYQRMSGDTRFLKDEKLLAYVRNIGEKLHRNLPPSGLKFQFFIIDSPDANAFNIPGGYVFVSRKLIAFAKTEDELAGVLAHELGHAAVHHVAGNMSDLFKQVLNVTQVTDQKDITEKYNLFLERVRTKSVARPKGHDSETQIEADRIGLHAMVAAGYDPNAFQSLFSRLVEEKARSGNWFSDLFSKSTPNEKRLREMIKATEQMPASCRQNRQAASDQYLKWQADVVSYREHLVNEELPGLLWKKDLEPRLRSDISHFAFSNDGKYFLAQDDFAISVIQRDPLKVAFQIPAEDAREAEFTPDGAFVIFGTESLRFEKWSVAEAKPVEIRELVVRRDCQEHEFSPDGRYLACIDFAHNLNVLDTQSGQKVWEKKKFATLTGIELLLWLRSELEDASSSDNFFNLEFSTDSRYLVATRSNNFRFTVTLNAYMVDKTDDAVVALDLTTLKPVNLNKELKQATRRSFLFTGPDKILTTNFGDAGIFSFPDGKRLSTFSLGAQIVERTGNPNYILIKPLSNATLGVFDIEKSKLVTGSRSNDVALWNDLMVHEDESGEIIITKGEYIAERSSFRSTVVDSLEIPVSSLGGLQSAYVSNNMEWLALSSRSRGGLWNLKTGERPIYVRGFVGGVVADSGSAIADFTKRGEMNHSLVQLNPKTGAITQMEELPERGARMYGRFVLTRTSSEADKNAEPGKKKDGKSDNAEPEWRMELRDVVQQKVIWAKDFGTRVPRYFFDDFSGRLIFYWDLGSETGKLKLKEDPALAERAKTLGNKDDDYLMEVVDVFAGKTIGTLLIETGNGSFYIRGGVSEGDWLILRDSGYNRVLAYSIKSGELVHRFFGSYAQINPTRNELMVENQPGEFTLYDLNTGTSKSKLRFRTELAFARFSLDGKRLFVLTSGQTAYAFDMDKMPVN
jgi:WD40 repeat protein